MSSYLISTIFSVVEKTMSCMMKNERGTENIEYPVTMNYGIPDSFVVAVVRFGASTDPVHHQLYVASEGRDTLVDQIGRR